MPASQEPFWKQMVEKYYSGDWTGDRLVFIGVVNHVDYIRKRHKIHVKDLDGNGLAFVSNEPSFKEHQIVMVFLAKSFLPAEEHAQFEAMNCQHTIEGKRGTKIDCQTDSVSGIVVDGIIKPLEAFPIVADTIRSMTNDIFHDTESHVWKLLAIEHLNNFVSFENMLGAKRWSHETTETKMGPCPTFYKKSKMSRLAECSTLFTKPKYLHWSYQATRKMDGSSMAVYFVRNDSPFFKALNPLPELPGPHMELSNGRVGVCSMNIELPQKDSCPFWRAALKYNLPAILNAQDKDYVVQGELVGWGVNGNRMGYAQDEIDFWAFDIWEPRWQARWLNANEVVEWCKDKHVQHVPVRMASVKLRKAFRNREAIQALADSEPGEGLVFKCLNEPGHRFKVHNRDYLALYGPN